MQPAERLVVIRNSAGVRGAARLPRDPVEEFRIPRRHRKGLDARTVIGMELLDTRDHRGKAFIGGLEEKHRLGAILHLFAADFTLRRSAVDRALRLR